MTKDEAQVRMYVMTERLQTLNEIIKILDDQCDTLLIERRKLIREYPTLDLGRFRR